MYVYIKLFTLDEILLNTPSSSLWRAVIVASSWSNVQMNRSLSSQPSGNRTEPRGTDGRYSNYAESKTDIVTAQYTGAN
jgi:hypothetical protein